MDSTTLTHEKRGSVCLRVYRDRYLVRPGIWVRNSLHWILVVEPVIVGFVAGRSHLPYYVVFPHTHTGPSSTC